MDLLIEFAKLIIPAALVLYAMYLVVKSFINKDLNQRMIESQTRNTTTVLPIRLQAYERICLLLERLSPNNMILRLNQGEMSAKEFQRLMLFEIREEYNHNVSQQVYMSEEAWGLVKQAKEDLTTLINQASEEMDNKATSNDLAKKIFEMSLEREDMMQLALSFVKDEIRQSF